MAVTAAAVAITSSLSSRPDTVVRPTASAPSSSARCDMDLSPGTRTAPVSAAQGEARQGWAAEAGWEAVEEAEDGPWQP